MAVMVRHDTMKHSVAGKNPLGLMKDRIWEECKGYREWRVETLQPDGKWASPEWLPAWGYSGMDGSAAKEAALACCVKSFTLGTARIARLTVHSKTCVVREEEMDQDEFLRALVRFGKV